MKNTALMLIFALFSFNTYAAEKAGNNLAIEYLTISNIKDVINASIQQYETQMFSAAKPEDKAMIHKMMVEAMGWEATKDQLANIVMNLYTKEELEASIAFMKSPAGASATAKNEEFSKQFASVISINMQKVLAECCAPKQ